VPDGLLRATTKQTVCIMYTDVRLQRVKKGFIKTAYLKYVFAHSNEGRKVIHGFVTED
jgi:hypothetical protein